METSVNPINDAVDYVTYTITAEELRLLSEYEKTRYVSARKESLYVRIHKLLGQTERVFTLGGIVVSNAALVGVEAVSIVYRRPLKITEKESDFEDGVIVDGQVECIAQVDPKTPLGNRLFLVAMVFGPVYAALSSQYSMEHIYHMAERLTTGVIADDPSTYIVYDQGVMNIQDTADDPHETVVYSMSYAGFGQTEETVSRFPTIIARAVRESDHSTNYGEIFPVIKRGRRVGFNCFIPYDCIFVEPTFYYNEDGDAEVDAVVNDNLEVTFRDSLLFINDNKSIQHLNRKFGTLLD